ncbi:AroM family protein [Curtobacterium sp. MCSS17_015]|uniref:AroM family protein n=1 Tax=Curtobacterium sp. MCSS17_015 TaxID=2175666 RepID=UPI000DA89800|nr:AroM family protein [Curtobacterium sp. MCSS17_015]WIB26592.1 AroM family protein [Curtobacterium sp. MCSS17_015]
MTRLGVVTIGQAPRTDLTPELAGWLPGVELVERGVLDDMDARTLGTMAPAADDHVLTTRLADGTPIEIGERQVQDRLPGVLAALEDEVDAVLLACTGPFDALPHTKPLFVPDALIALGTAALATAIGGPGGARVGVVCPLPAQQDFTVAKFAPRLAGQRVLTAPSSPYTGTDSTLADAGRALQAGGAELIALDCIGYSEAMRKVVVATTGLPVVLARSVAARLAAEVLDGLQAAVER